MPEPVTARALQIILLMADELENKEIAHALNVSIKTVEFHKARIYKRLGVRGPVGAVRWAIREGHVKA